MAATGQEIACFGRRTAGIKAKDLNKNKRGITGDCLNDSYLYYSNLNQKKFSHFKIIVSYLISPQYL